MLSRKNCVREALLTAALFGSIGAAFAQTPEPAKDSARSFSPFRGRRSG